MKAYRQVFPRIAVVAEVLIFFGTNKRWWLLPMLVILFLFGALIVAAQGSALAPFIYAFY
jgi:NAD/NADP transhydrogenase beta subunit